MSPKCILSEAPVPDDELEKEDECDPEELEARRLALNNGMISKTERLFLR